MVVFFACLSFSSIFAIFFCSNPPCDYRVDQVAVRVAFSLTFCLLAFVTSSFFLLMCDVIDVLTLCFAFVVRCIPWSCRVSQASSCPLFRILIVFACLVFFFIMLGFSLPYDYRIIQIAGLVVAILVTLTFSSCCLPVAPSMLIAFANFHSPLRLYTKGMLVDLQYFQHD